MHNLHYRTILMLDSLKDAYINNDQIKIDYYLKELKKIDNLQKIFTLGVVIPLTITLLLLLFAIIYYI